MLLLSCGLPVPIKMNNLIGTDISIRYSCNNKIPVQIY